MADCSLRIICLQAQCGYAADEYVECEMMVLTRSLLLALSQFMYKGFRA